MQCGVAWPTDEDVLGEGGPLVLSRVCVCVCVLGEGGPLVLSQGRRGRGHVGGMSGAYRLPLQHLPLLWRREAGPLHCVCVCVCVCV